ncbi:hypothetical protein DDP54_05350 [Cellulomonas sp. WB94]|uniref:hypothetical protein n=1 Tax=Cellulomonas sp. WB94 TaxID=2173174 RepID=UPI000D573A12|nr:hypothetical protein [Cellulomonas sp. WB94]PVU82524.1 hypothetical protein DDP54_05350 [Cellulomonas sp. WB94]
MSTSDPHIPSGEPDPMIDSTSPPSTTRGAAARAAAAHAADRPAPTPPPGTDATDTPSSVVREPVAEPVVEPVAGRPSYAATATHTPAAHADVTPPPVAPTTRTDVVEPVPPRSTGFGGHLWGVLIGVLATAAALALGLVGQGRILGVQADTWDASLDVWGIAFVTAAVLVLAVVVYLGARTAAAPISGGILAAVAGAVFLYAPGIARNETMRWLATTNSRDTVSHATVAGTSGTILLVGFLLLMAGVATAAAKRRGRVLGEFRERGRAA